MSIRETPPEKGRGRNTTANWSNLKVARTERHECFACGKAHWFDCHTAFGVTQPCLTLATAGELPCPRCSEPVETMGYVALWLAWNQKPMFALVHHDQRERSDALKRGEPVWVGRDDHKTAGIYVVSRYGAKVPFLKLDRPAFLAAVDLLPTLLKVWKLPQLAAWVRCQKRVSDNAVSLPDGKASEVCASQTNDDHKPDAQAYTAPDSATTNDVFAASVNRIKNRERAHDPSANGKK